MAFFASGPGFATVGVLLVPNSGGSATAYFAVSPRAVRGAPLVADGALHLAPAANRRLTRCSLSHRQAITALGVPVPESLLPPANLRVPRARSATTRTQAEGHGRALSVPKGASVGWGVLPTANRHANVALCSPHPAPQTFGEIMCQDFGRQIGEIPGMVNSVALLGEQELLDDIASSAQRAVTMVGNFTPQLVDMIYDRFIRESLPPQGLVRFLKTKALNIVIALEILQGECKEGYVRDESLARAITLVREAASRLLPKTYVLPPPYAGTVPPPAEKSQKLAHFTALAVELYEISVLIQQAMLETLKKT